MKTFNPTLSILSGVALATSGMVLGTAPPVAAAVLWDWSYSGGGSIGGSGTFTTTDEDTSFQSYQITGITGTSEGNTITSLVAPGSISRSNNDNKIAVSGVPYDLKGIGFLTNNDPPNIHDVYNVYSVPAPQKGDVVQLFSPVGSFLTLDWNAKQVGVVGGSPPTAVPEPSSLLGYITLGGLMLGSTLRKAIK